MKIYDLKNTNKIKITNSGTAQTERTDKQNEQTNRTNRKIKKLNSYLFSFQAQMEMFVVEDTLIIFYMNI